MNEPTPFAASLHVLLVSLVLIVSVVLLVTSRTAAQDPGPQPYAHPYTGDAIVLRNNKAFVAVSAKLGRIVAFGPAEGPNLLWIGEEKDVDEVWKNYGGDKVWPSPQDDWPKTHGRAWPPTPGIDGPPWKLIAVSSNIIIMESPVSPPLGIQVRRHIRLFHDWAFLQVRTTITRVAPSDARVHVWPVTQVAMPEYCLIDVIEKQSDHETFWIPGGLPATAMATTRLDDGLYQYNMPKVGSHKIGSYGTFVAAVYPKWVFVQHVEPHDPQADYADSSNVQLFSNERYVELEATSPAKKLEVGESLELTVDWLVFKRPAETKPEMIGMIIEAMQPKPIEKQLLEKLKEVKREAGDE